MSDTYGLPPQRQAPGEWDPFAAPVRDAIQQQMDEKTAADRATRLQLTAAIFGTPQGRAWLQERLTLEMARPSYTPGDTLDRVAWNESRKAWLHELQAELDEATRPSAAESEE